MNGDFGFGKRSARPTDSSENDLSGIPKGPIRLSEETTAQAERAGDGLGFRGQLEPAAPQKSTGRRIIATPSKSIFIKGPERTIDWFVEFTNQHDFRSYWEAIEELKKRSGL